MELLDVVVRVPLHYEAVESIYELVQRPRLELFHLVLVWSE